MQGEPTKCPYRHLCKCKGDDPERGEWEPSLGFKRVPEGVLCLDWNVVIPFESVSQLKDAEPEGRHVVDAIEAADRIDATQKRYSRGEKNKAAQRRYRGSPRGRAAQQKFTLTEKFKLAYQKYYYSDKGQAAHLARRELVKDFRVAARWLRDNPGKTFEDFLKEVGKQEQEAQSSALAPAGKEGTFLKGGEALLGRKKKKRKKKLTGRERALREVEKLELGERASQEVKEPEL